MGQVHEVQDLDKFAENQQTVRQDIISKIGDLSKNSRDKFKNGIDDIIKNLKQKISDENDDQEQNKASQDDKNPQIAGAKTDSVASEQGKVLENIGFS